MSKSDYGGISDLPNDGIRSTQDILQDRNDELVRDLNAEKAVSKKLNSLYEESKVIRSEVENELSEALEAKQALETKLSLLEESRDGYRRELSDRVNTITRLDKSLKEEQGENRVLRDMVMGHKLELARMQGYINCLDDQLPPQMVPENKPRFSIMFNNRQDSDNYGYTAEPWYKKGN